jgi:uncharacterized membrane protein (UPF0136 family)
MTLAALCGAGAIAGGLRGSRASMYAGSVFAGLYGASAWMIKDHPLDGHNLALLTSSLLFVAMGGRFYVTKKKVPAVLGALGGGATLYHGYKVFEWAQ